MRPALHRAGGYLVAILAIGAATGLFQLFRTHINPITVALALLLIVLFVATRFGSGPAVLASIAGVFCFNFFFLPPVGTLSIAAAENWIALAAFLITAVTTGELSARARRRAQEAEAGRREIERLYTELRDAFERASEAEALRRSERLKSALLDAVTHDIRTPLTSIKASVTTLLDELSARSSGAARLNEEGRREMLEVIDEEADRLNRFVEDLIDLARIEAGRLELRLEWGTVDEIVSAALDRAQPLTRRHTVEVSIDKELRAVRVDAKAVAQVVYALVDNAAKYSAGGTTITVSGSQADDMICLMVEDQGPGIAPNLRERVFDKFFRAMRDGAAAAQPAGTGMGLAIARGIVEAHGGRIWIEDASGGRGTRVALALPLGDEETVAGDVEDTRRATG
ncbi:MAG: ATP-binding protein [Blastocatellia bacterium]